MSKKRKSKVVSTQSDGTEIHGFVDEVETEETESTQPVEEKKEKTPKALKVRGKDMKFNNLKGNQK